MALSAYRAPGPFIRSGVIGLPMVTTMAPGAGTGTPQYYLPGTDSDSQGRSQRGRTESWSQKANSLRKFLRIFLEFTSKSISA